MNLDFSEATLQSKRAENSAFKIMMETIQFSTSVSNIHIIMVLSPMGGIKNLNPKTHFSGISLTICFAKTKKQPIRKTANYKASFLLTQCRMSHG
jgi:hypothetical protein